ncbi:MAG: HAD-IA family hydrolase [Betaproteobacteria bacterium]|nr:HAD-IA family hydrolase [Betaproteobacteria bacterium]
MKPYRLVIFDWDGTLIDSAAHIASSLQAASRDLGLPVPSDEAARHVIGLGLDDAMAYLFPVLARARHAEVSARYRHHYLSGESAVRLFDGVAEGVRSLRGAGVALAVATGKSRVGLDRALDATGLRPYFHASRCADEGSPKPHPAMLAYLLDHLQVSPDDALMVGDTTHDIEMAHAAGVASLAVTYGAHDEAKLLAAAPGSVVRSPLELWEQLAR